MMLSIQMKSSVAAPLPIDMLDVLRDRLYESARFTHADEGDSGPLLDANGNTIGTWKIEAEA